MNVVIFMKTINLVLLYEFYDETVPFKRVYILFTKASNFSIPDFMWNNHCHGDSLETWTSVGYEREHTTTSHCGSKEHLQSFPIRDHGNR